jgi:Arm DNA-binding domain
MLTDTRVRSVKPTQRPQKLTDARGLYLLVTPSGGKYWRYDYSFNGKRKTLAFGVYPDVGLGKARERHYGARQQLAEGSHSSGSQHSDPLANERAPAW